MKCFRLLWCSLVLAVMAVQVSAQGTADIYKVVKGNNGQSYLLAQANTGSVLYTDVYFRIGPVYEMDSTSGISLMITRIMDARIGAALKGKNIHYHSNVDPAQIGFHFESGSGDLDYILTLVHDKIMNAKFDEESVDEAKTEIRADLDSIAQSEKAKTSIRLYKHLWGKDYKKLNIYGDAVSYKRINAGQFKSFHYRYFLPLNNSIVITGSFPEQATVDKLQRVFDDFRTREFNPELINKVIEFKPIITSIQILSKGGDTALATVSYQAPGARQDRSATYCAYMLTQLINDRNGRIARAMKDSNIAELRAEYDGYNFQGTLTISAKILTHNYNTVFADIDSMVQRMGRKDYYNEAELAAAAKDITTEFSGLRNHPHYYMTRVARYRFSNDENYFPALADSIQNVTVAGMQSYFKDYFEGRSGVRCLYADVDSTVPADQHYYALDDSINDVTFTYPQNITDIDSVTGKEDLQRLIQWLKINPDVHIQVNGYSDKGEYIKAYDTTVIRFLRNTPTFRKAMPDVIKVNYLRIEMMRAMKIAKAIYEAGIGEDRIAGTSMAFSSDSDEKAAANRKCTVTLEKIQSRMSLYEYHFGKKREADPIPAAK